MTEPVKVEHSVCYKMSEDVFNALVMNSNRECLPCRCGADIVDRLRIDGGSVKMAKGIWMTKEDGNRRVWVWVEGLWLKGIVDMCCDHCYDRADDEIKVLKKGRRDDVVVWIE